LSKRVLAALLACAALVVVAAGCGGGGDTTTSGGNTTTSGGDGTSGGEETSADSGPAPTRAVFVKEADAICEEADAGLNDEIEGYAEENGISTQDEPSQAQQEEIYAEVVLPRVAKQGEEIDALTPPEGDEAKVEEIVQALDSGVEEAEADPSLLVEGKTPFADASSKAQAYGLKVCGSE
jgi:hypothetical protein